MMRRLLCILFFISFSTNVFGDEELLRKAENAYDEKKYRLAIENYEALIAQGYESYQLFFNLGNAYYRNNELGMAIYNYELARKMEPNDEDVRINLAIASSKTIDQIESKENFFISAVKTNLLSSLSTHAWAWLTIACISIFAVLFFVYLISGKIAVKRVAFVISALALLSFFATYLLGFSAVQAKYENKFAIILSQEARVMNEPTESAMSKFGLHEGTKVQVVKRNGEWLLIKLDNGNEGWLKLGDVGVI